MNIRSLYKAIPKNSLQNYQKYLFMLFIHHWYLQTVFHLATSANLQDPSIKQVTSSGLKRDCPVKFEGIFCPKVIEHSWNVPDVNRTEEFGEKGKIN